MSQWDEWLGAVQRYLIDTWGLDVVFAYDSARLLAYFLVYELNPVVTSGFRSPAKQQELLRRWEAGDPSVVVKPAVNSKHSTTNNGRPAATAIDISTSNKKLAAQIASALGVGAGYYFSKSDPVHFYKATVKGEKTDV